MKKYLIPLAIFLITAGFLYWAKEERVEHFRARFKKEKVATYTAPTYVRPSPNVWVPDNSMATKSPTAGFEKLIAAASPANTAIPNVGAPLVGGPAPVAGGSAPATSETFNTTGVTGSSATTPTVYFRMIISLFGFLASLYIILSKKFDDSINKWGFSTIGMILGFWLK